MQVFFKCVFSQSSILENCYKLAYVESRAWEKMFPTLKFVTHPQLLPQGLLPHSIYSAFDNFFCMVITPTLKKEWFYFVHRGLDKDFLDAEYILH